MLSFPQRTHTSYALAAEKRGVIKVGKRSSISMQQLKHVLPLHQLKESISNQKRKGHDEVTLSSITDQYLFKR